MSRELPSDLDDAAPTAKVCYLVLDAHEQAISQKHLREDTHCPTRSVRRALSTLISEGYVTEVIDPERDPQQTYYTTRE